ncbi:MAG: hypothetical protein ACYTFA_09045 [Planctomycetota bacterium]|jgi:hypothetical protein
MGKMLKKCCMLALAGGMMFGGGCLDIGGIWKFAGRGLVEGAGWDLGAGMTNAWVTRPLADGQQAINDVNLAEAIQAEIDARADAEE